MKRFLVIVDMQNDFIDGVLGTKETMRIVDNIVNKINNFNGEIIVTLDTHLEDFKETNEGKILPLHCVKGTEGWRLNSKVAKAVNSKSYNVVEKTTFGATELPRIIKKLSNNEEFMVELVGVCTDICVISNALLLKAHFPEADITVDALCCAGATHESHKAALDVMRQCQINIIRDNIIHNDYAK